MIPATSTTTYDHASTSNDTQYQTNDKPDEAFSIDSPGFDADEFTQSAVRSQFIELAEWHDGTQWNRIAPLAHWYNHATSVLPDSRKGGLNQHGAGEWFVDIPNTRPSADAGPDQEVALGAMVTLAGAGIDADNDPIVEYRWEQTAGPPVQLSSTTDRSPTFTAPMQAGDLTFSLVVSDLTKRLEPAHRPSNYLSLEDSVTIAVR